MSLDEGQRATFNLKAVVQETGLKPDTLRAWERRYGLPQPDRTDGGHRLYSKKDIETLKWLVSRQEEGMSISRAINLWHQLDAEGKDPLLLDGFGDVTSSSSVPVYTGGEKTREVCQAWVEACLNFDEQRAEHILNQAFALYSPEVVCFEILQRGLTTVGDKWHKDLITVQQEHFATSLAMRKLEGLVAATPPPSRPGRFVVACAPYEEHSFNPLLITFLLRRHGWEAIYLGADVPAYKMEVTMAQTKPQLVILTAQQLFTAANLMELATVLRSENIHVAYGGLIFNLWPAIRKRIPGYFLGERMDNVPQAIEKNMGTLGVLPNIEPLAEQWQQALDHFQTQRAYIENAVWHQLSPSGVPYDHMAHANAIFGRNIQAALLLGNIEYVGNTFSWVKGLFVADEMDADTLTQYLKAYHAALQQHLSEDVGHPIVEWLGALIASL
ncbi:MAG: MerR family transcriptional regulator [Anaerolineae bacterium]|nr:MerR family transcriptional regulator [Anaerolineae bacterium]